MTEDDWNEIIEPAITTLEGKIMAELNEAFNGNPNRAQMEEKMNSETVAIRVAGGMAEIQDIKFNLITAALNRLTQRDCWVY